MVSAFVPFRLCGREMDESHRGRQVPGTGPGIKQGTCTAQGLSAEREIPGHVVTTAKAPNPGAGS